MSSPALVAPGVRDVERILVVHARGGMGDVLLSTPVLEALHLRYPQAALDILVRRGAVAMVAQHPNVNTVLVGEEGELDTRAGLQRWIHTLRERRYTLGIVLWSKFPEAWMLFRAGVRHRVGQDSRLMYSWMYTRRVHIRTEHGDDTSHWVECLLDYARAVGADVEQAEPRLYVAPDAAAAADRILQENDVAAGMPYVVLHVGRGTPLGNGRLPTAPFARAGDALARAFGVPVVLTGGRLEESVVADVAQQMQEQAVPLAARLTVPELGAVLARAMVAVANDSGPMHMAAAVDAPTVGLFVLKTDLPKRWGPCGAGNQIVRPSKFRCRPECTKETCLDFACYEDLDADAVVEAARRALRERPRAVAARRAMATP